jgi:hypothetical protein
MDEVSSITISGYGTSGNHEPDYTFQVYLPFQVHLVISCVRPAFSRASVTVITCQSNRVGACLAGGVEGMDSAGAADSSRRERAASWQGDDRGKAGIDETPDGLAVGVVIQQDDGTGAAAALGTTFLGAGEERSGHAVGDSLKGGDWREI